MKYQLGILGTGTMGSAILSRIVNEKKLLKTQIALFDIDNNKLSTLEKDGFCVCHSAQQIADECEAVLFAVKPQHFRSITDTVRFSENTVVLSIMAGVQIKTLRKAIGFDCATVRIMPNMPCRIGSGVCAVKFDAVDKETKEKVLSWLRSCGEVIEIEEKYFDAVTSVSGSGPAYVYMFIDAMIRGGMAGGLTYEQSKVLTLSTVVGTALTVKNSDEDLDLSVEKVCSKGGTTIEAVQIYRDKQLKETIIEGINACRRRSEELSKG